MRPLFHRNVLLCVTGSIAAYKSGHLVRELVKAGAQVQVVMTRAAHDFVTPLTLATVSGRQALTELVTGESTWNDHVHLARWADYLQEIINGRGSQIWEKEGLAARWNLETKSLGYAQTGMEMDEKTVMLLRMPKKAVLLDYACRAFAAAQQAIGTIDDADFYKVYETLHGENWRDGCIGPIISTWMTHDNRHLGMIECLVGVQGLSGSADA